MSVYTSPNTHKTYIFPIAEIPAPFVVSEIFDANGYINKGTLTVEYNSVQDFSNNKNNRNIQLTNKKANCYYEVADNGILFFLRLPIKKYIYGLNTYTNLNTYIYVPIIKNSVSYLAKYSEKTNTRTFVLDENYETTKQSEFLYTDENLNGFTNTMGISWSDAEKRVNISDYYNMIYEWFEKNGYNYNNFNLVYNFFMGSYATTSCQIYETANLNSIFPIFNITDYESLGNYLKDGYESVINGTSNPVNSDDIKLQLSDIKFNTDWLVYVTDSANTINWKDISITWHTNAFSENNIETLHAYAVFYDENGNQLGSTPYNQGIVNLDVSFSSLPENIPEEGYKLKFKVIYDNYVSSTCFVNILPYTPFTEYGIYNTDDGSTIQILYNQNPNIDSDYDKNTEDTDENILNGGTSGSSSAFNALNLLTTTYVINESNLRKFSTILWNDDFMQNIKLLNNSPIENVVSCKMFPISVSGQETDIICGNVTMTNCKGGVINNNFHQIIGSINVPSYYNSFLDYSPFTSLEIFLPFIGFKELDTSIFMGKTLRVEYIHDLITGACKAMIFANNIYYTSFDGISGVDIPITASNRAQVETGYIGGALGAIPQLLTLDFSSLAKNALSTATQQYHYQTQGSYSPACGAYESHLCYIIFNRPSVQYPKTYNHDYGRPCMLSQRIGDLSGFTKCSDNIDLTGIASTNEEKEIIKQLLTTGVYL